MSYQVIARKYRPQRFADVVGQEHVSQTLANAIEQNRIAHAYLFCGPRGTGKTTIARIFAMCLNCTGGPKPDYPEGDPRAREIAEGRSLDVLEIDGASNNGVEQVRELRETCKFAPATSKFKIYIIDEVHMLSPQAFNALLKTLEEPPEHVKFMFATTEPEKILPTILSRCQRFDLRRIPATLIVKHLSEIAKKEQVKIDEPALHAIARGAEGGMRDAESTLDQLISFCGDRIEEADVLSMFGLTARSQILGLAGAVLDGHVDGALRGLNDLARQGKDLSRLLSDLLNHFRNLLIYQVAKGDLNLLEVSETEGAALKEQSARVSVDALTRIMEVLAECESRLRDAASRKIMIEVALLKAIQARNTMSLDSVLSQLQQLRSERGGTGGAAATESSATRAPARESSSFAALREAVAEPAPAAPAPRLAQVPASPIAEAVTPASAQAVSAAPANDQLEVLWQNVIVGVARVSPFAKTYLLEAHPVSFEKNVLVIGYDPEFADHLPLVDNSKNHAIIQTKLGELGYPGAMVKFIKSDAPPGRPRTVTPVESAPPPAPVRPEPAKSAVPPTEARKEAPSERPFNKEDFKDDPLIRKALEIFKGQIVEVRA